MKSSKRKATQARPRVKRPPVRQRKATSPLVGLAAPLPLSVSKLENDEDFLALVRWATQPRGGDYYFGAFPAEDPSVRRFLARCAQADRFHRVCEARQMPRVMDTADEWVEIGKWLDEAIEAAPDIAGERKDHLWNGARQTALRAGKELVEIGVNVDAHRVKYQVADKALDLTINEVEKRILKRKADAESNSFTAGITQACTFLAGIVVGGVTGGAVYYKTASALRAAVSTALAGGLGAWVGGKVGNEAAERVQHAAIADLDQDLSDLATLRERRKKLQEEGVPYETASKIINILRLKREELREPYNPDREQLMKSIKRDIDRVLEQSRKEGGPGPGIRAARRLLSDVYTEAMMTKKWDKAAKAVVEMAEIRNDLCRKARAAADLRVDRFAAAFAKGRAPRVSSEREWIWG